MVADSGSTDCRSQLLHEPVAEAFCCPADCAGSPATTCPRMNDGRPAAASRATRPRCEGDTAEPTGAQKVDADALLANAMVITAARLASVAENFIQFPCSSARLRPDDDAVSITSAIASGEPELNHWQVIENTRAVV